MSVFFVPREAAGMRLDLFLTHELRRTSRNRTQDIIRNSAYSADGRKLKPSDRVQSEARIYLWRAPWDETPVPTEVQIVYEDAYLMAVDKPAFLPVHPTARYHQNTLIMVLKRRFPEQWLSLGHRIDRETSGLLLISKTPECDRALKRQLEMRESIVKVYTALTWGIPALPSQPFRYVQNLELDPDGPYKVEMRTTDGGLFASTIFEVLDTRKLRDMPYAKVRATLETGRQHQIRVHLKTLGTAIVGDKLYGPDPSAFARGADGELTEEDLTLLELPRHALHATELSLPHPITGCDLHVKAPFPPDLEAFWNSLKPQADPR
jgi:23S rRNA pseudouridine1911/1915/1917 synthase